MSVIPGPLIYKSADEWLAGPEKYGVVIGAEPLDAFGFGYILSRGEVRAFWDQVAEWGSHAVSKLPEDASIEDILRAAWPILTQQEAQ